MQRHHWREAVFEGAPEVALATGASLAAREYSHKPNNHIFGLPAYYPGKYHDGLMLEIDMEAASKVVRHDANGSAPVYTIANLRVITDMVRLKPAVEQARLAELDAGMVVHYPLYHTIVDTVSTSLTQRYDLGTMNGRVKNIQVFQTKNATVAGVGADVWAAQEYNNESSYRFQLGAKYLSEAEVRVSATQQAEYLHEWTKSQNLFVKPMGLYGKASLTPAVLISTKFVIGQKVDRSKTDSLLSSLKDSNENKLMYEVKYSSAPAAATLYVVAALDKELVLFKGKAFEDRDFRNVGTPAGLR